MRVLYVSHTGEVGGAEHSLIGLIRALPETVEAHVAAPPGTLDEMLRDVGLEAHRLPATAGSLRPHPMRTSRRILQLAAAGRGVRDLVSRLDIDVVHANSIRAGLSLRFAGRPVRRRTLVHVRDRLPPRSLPGLSVRGLGRGNRGLIANSAYTARSLSWSRDPVHVVHNGIELERFRGARDERTRVRRELGLGEGDVVLAVVAQITPWKGQDDAIRIVSLLAARGLRVKLLLVGAPIFATVEMRFDNVAFERDLRALARREGIADDVLFLGRRDDIPALLGAVDLLLVPSWEETFGRTILEAMAAGVPVAATSVGGPPEIIAEPSQGLLLSPRRPELWADELAALLVDRSRLGELSRNGRARVADSFRAETHARRIAALYDEMVRPAAGV